MIKYRKQHKFRLLLDFDDVIVHTLEEALSLYFQRHGVLYLQGDVDNWSYLDDKSVYKDIFHQKDFYKKLKPKRDAISVIKKWLEEDTMDIFIVTACLTPEAYQQKLLWLEEHLPEFPQSRLLPVMEKTAIWGDLLVDDGLHNIVSYDEFGGDTLLYTIGHNLRDKTFKRVSSFKDVDDYLKIMQFKQVEGQ